MEEIVWVIDRDGPGNVEVTVSGVLVTTSLQGETGFFLKSPLLGRDRGFVLEMGSVG